MFLNIPVFNKFSSLVITETFSYERSLGDNR